MAGHERMNEEKIGGARESGDILNTHEVLEGFNKP
jgi:hypothetical protein